MKAQYVGALEDRLPGRDFHTVRPPAIIGTDPADGNQSADYFNGFRIYFNSPMDVKSLDPNISILPEATKVYTYYSEFEKSFYINYAFKPSTDYTITLGPDMADPYGNKIGATTTIAFTTRPAPGLLAGLRLEDRWILHEFARTVAAVHGSLR